MALGGRAELPHLPHPAPVDAYGNGGFRFAGMSHRGSLLCFPDGIWAWPINDVTEVDEAALAAALIRLFSLSDAARAGIGARGRAWVATQFDAPSIARATLAVYADIARTRPAG